MERVGGTCNFALLEQQAPEPRRGRLAFLNVSPLPHSWLIGRLPSILYLQMHSILGRATLHRCGHCIGEEPGGDGPAPSLESDKTGQAAALRQTTPTPNRYP